ncbi:FAD-binding domain-containing protein [Roridomyces roridus]|uniref:FAD-binding domain-containing protein n=1 Tax=Roridomyces roridus TaxID=1738132 RepID=A0AAD7B4Q5_9AGAR|nr:FAD-binding domain-containing protein [Roridomyces roridus]
MIFVQYPVMLSAVWSILALSAAPLPLLATSLRLSAWAELNRTVSGRLVQGVPFARACFPHVGAGVAGSFNKAQCEAVQTAYVTPEVLQTSLGAYINTQWETCQATSEQCLLNFTDPADPVAIASHGGICAQGSVPDFGVNVQSAEDVKAAFTFSRETGVPLVVKGTGHDYKGRSGGAGTLAIWTHNLGGVVHEPKFIPTGCSKKTPTRNAVTIGAGVAYEELVDFADANSLTIPAGGCITVGAAGGYPQGGGHSMFSNVHGLAADRVIEIEVVTPRGDHLIANECQNTDIFWAMRGGGGGTFGVTLKMTTLVFPATTVNAVFATIDPSVPGQLLQFFQFMTDNALSYAQQGWGYYLYPSLPGISMSNTILSEKEAQASVKTLMDLVTKNFTGTNTWEMTLEPNYKTYYPKYVTRIPVPVGFAMTISSRLMPAKNFETAAGRQAIASAMTSIMKEAPVAIAFGVAPFFHGNTNNTSVNPAWYDSLWHLAIANTWNYNQTASSLTTIYQDLSTGIEPFRKLAPTSGAYPNEADVYEPNFAESFWGSNYPRLLAIKQKYDPEHLLDCWQCVGWKGPKDPRYKCYIPIEGL